MDGCKIIEVVQYWEGVMKKIRALMVLHGNHYFVYLFSVSGIIMLMFSWLIARQEMDGSFLTSFCLIIFMLLTKLMANETYSANSRQFAREMKYSGISSFTQIMFYTVTSFTVIVFAVGVGSVVIWAYKHDWNMMENVYFISSLLVLGNYMISFLYIFSISTRRLASRLIKLLFLIMYIALAIVVLIIVTSYLVTYLVLLTIVSIPTSYLLGYMIDKYDW